MISWWVLLPFILTGFVVGWYLSRQYRAHLDLKRSTKGTLLRAKRTGKGDLFATS